MSNPCWDWLSWRWSVFLRSRDNQNSSSCVIGAVTLALLRMGKWLLPIGKQLLVCDRFPQGEIASGKLPEIRQKEQKSYPWQFPSYEVLKRLNKSRESEMYQTVEIRCCLRVVFALAPSPTRNSTQSSKTQRILLWKLVRGLINSKRPWNTGNFEVVAAIF